MNPKNKIVRVGIAGLGRSGWTLHALVLQSMPDSYRVESVFDANEARANEAAQKLHCTAASSYENLVHSREVDLVVVALPSHLHVSAGIEAASSGKHVLVEKPFATDAAGARRLDDAGRANGVIVTCNQNLRFSADFLKVREVVQSGLLGKLLQLRIAWHGFKRRWDWQTLLELGGGTLNNDGSHVIDQALVLMGEGELEVFCDMARTPLCAGDAEDHLKVLLYGKGLPLADLEITNACALPQDPWLVLGTKGTLGGGKAKLQWKHIDETALPVRKVLRESTPDRSYNREEFTWRSGSFDVPQENYEMSIQRLYSNLHGALTGKAPLEVTPESLVRQIAILEKCRKFAVLRSFSSW
jgi:scyllo-inositol 2-dehydrogenase (NADP+)